MRKIAFVIIAIFCVNSAIFSQEEKVETALELRYFESDNAFYLDNKRLSDNEIEKALSNNPLALKSWERGNFNFNANKNLKIATGVLLISGGLITIISFAYGIAYIPVAILGGGGPNTGGWITAGLILFSAGVVTAISIPITKINYKDYYSDAARIYNRGLQSKTAVSLHIGLTGNGFGLNLKF